VGEGALAFRVGPAVPNPGAGGPVAFALELPSAARVRACVVDAAGRRVRTLATGRDESPAGSHSLVWDARGEGGARLAAGVYFVTVETDRGRARRKVVLLR
jgi:flagellar hook assembly protein FlgD